MRAHEATCPFCGSTTSVSAPLRFALILGALPLVFGCGEGEGPAPTTPAKVDPASTKPVTPEPEPAPTTATRPPVPADDPDEWGHQSMPPDLGAQADPPPEPEVDRPLATKYGGPPRPPEPRPPEPRPAKKYGGPPRPDPDDDPLGGL